MSRETSKMRRSGKPQGSDEGWPEWMRSRHRRAEVDMTESSGAKAGGSMARGRPRWRVPGAAAASLTLLGLTILGASSPAGAAPGPPYTPGASANALVGGSPAIARTCPPASSSPNTSSSGGGVTVSNGTALCDAVSAASTGQAVIGGAGGTSTSIPTFSATCQNVNGRTNGGATVPAGTRINGGPPTGPVGVTSFATVVFANGTTANLNEVAYSPAQPLDTMVTRTAIRVTGGPSSGAVIGRVTCGGPYPLAVEVAAPAAASDLPAQLTSHTGSSSPIGPLLAVGIVVLIAAQVGAALLLLRRRATQHR